MTTSANNVDPQEIEKFNSIAQSWWDLEGDFKPLHLLNPARLAYIQERALGLTGKSILDIGCGGGILAESMAKLATQVSGIDLAQDSINVAKLHALETGVNNVLYQITSAEDFSAQHLEQFDVVTCMEMLEHVPNPESIVQSAAQAVKVGGDVFFSTLNKNLKSYLLAVIAAENVLKLVPKGTHEYEKFIKPSQLIEMAEKYGLKARNSTGLHFNPITESVTLKANVDVNYLIHFERVE